ncbi:MAG: hypothetical protein HYW90_01140 [Candidatus Sungbacteria bacterium]|nr:hypothetical protein [Candidatus Sungbacteria bacterium]
MMVRRDAVFFAGIIVLAVFLSGCASTGLSIIKKESFDFRTTGLFVKSCQELKQAEREIESPPKKGFLAKLNPVSLFKSDPKERVEKLQTTVNDCTIPDIERMVEVFKSIRETDEKSGILGDTRAEVRKKGFTIYSDETERVHRQNTRVLSGNDALAEVGMSVSPPPLQKPEEIKAYTEFMKSHYGEQYFERGLKKVTDRICINNDESLEIGNDFSFIIVWRGDYVLSRLIKGGLINNPKKESALFKCPAGFIGDLFKSGVSRGVNMFIP